MSRRLSLIAVFAGAAALAACGQNAGSEPETAEAGEVNLYTARHYDADLALYERFTEETGIRVNRIEGNADQLIARMTSEGANSPADVFVVADASGTFNQTTREAAWARMTAAGAQLMTWFGIACELHRDWRNDVEGLATLLNNHIPDYRNRMNSYSAITTAK